MAIEELPHHRCLNRKLKVELWRELLRLRHAFEISASHETRREIAMKAVAIGDLLQIEIGSDPL